MITVKEIKPKMTPGKKTIEFKDLLLNEMKFVDETGDITQEVLEKFPEEIETISFKVTIELPDLND